MTALAGVRVLDMTQVLAGPYSTMFLADMGADVVIVEDTSGGRRNLGPATAWGDGAAFLALNRNKRSLSVDLRTPEGRAVVQDLAKTADVFVENYRVGVADRLGVGWDELSSLNPRLVYASISGFGQTGPDRDKPGYDILIQASAGIMSVTGEEGGAPAKAGLPVIDLSAGLVCSNAILAALIARDRTGRGQRIDTSLYDAAVTMAIWESAELWSNGVVPGPLGSAHRGAAPYQALRTADGHITVGVNNEKFWGLLCEAIERPDLVADPRFANNSQRVAHRQELSDVLEVEFGTRTSAEWLDLLTRVGVPVAPILSYDAVLASPQTLARELVTTVNHPIGGEHQVLGVPAKLSDTPAAVRSAAPLLGADTCDLLLEAGYTSEEIMRLVDAGVVRVADGYAIEGAV